MLLGALATSRYQRVREAVLLKTLGATRRQLLQIACVEYLGLGLLGAGTALVLATLAGWALVRFVFDARFTAPLGSLGALSLAVVALTVAVGSPEQPGPLPPHAARGPARRMKELLRAHPRLSAVAALAMVAIGFVVVRSRDNAWSIINERSQGVAIVAFGDSLTSGYQMATGESYPEQLSRLIGRPIVNRGVSGNTTADGLARLEADVLSESPRLVLLSLGANDMVRRQPIDETFANLRQIVDRIQARGALVVLIGVEGLPLVHGDYGARYRALARETGCVYVPDMLDGVFGDSGLMVDQFHPNAAGYARIARRIDSEVGDYLRR